LWNRRGVPDETTCLKFFFRCLGASSLICMQLSNVCANKLNSTQAIRSRIRSGKLQIVGINTKTFCTAFAEGKFGFVSNRWLDPWPGAQLQARQIQQQVWSMSRARAKPLHIQTYSITWRTTQTSFAIGYSCHTKGYRDVFLCKRFLDRRRSGLQTEAGRLFPVPPLRHTLQAVAGCLFLYRRTRNKTITDFTLKANFLWSSVACSLS